MKNIFFLLLLCIVAWQNTMAQAQRTVLIEEFTQASCGPCAAANPGLNTLLNANTDRVVSVKYQTNWPGNDPMNTQTQTWVGPRVSYYGVQGVPHVVMDGADVAGSGDPYSLTQAVLNAEASETTPFTIDLTHTYSADFATLNVTATITALSAVTESNLKFHLALTEDHIVFNAPPGSNGETEFFSVMRKMMPNASGTALPSTWTAGQTETITLSTAVPTYIYDVYQMALVGFVQNNTTKDVKQAKHISVDPVFQLDAAVNAMQGVPTDISCGDYATFTPSVVLGNTGSSNITNVEFSMSLAGDNVGTYSWTGNIAQGATQNVALPEVTTAVSGLFEVEIMSINGQSTDNYLANNVISQPFNFLSSIGLPAPITQNYSSTTFPPVGWALLNPDGDASWERATPTGSSGAAFINFYAIQSGTDELVMPTADLTNSSSAQLTFRVAYAPYDATYTDDLYVYVSTNCGDNWTQVYHKGNTTLATASATTSEFSPTASQWRTETIDLSNYVDNNVLVKFSGESGYGNNLYIDDVNLTEVEACTPPTASVQGNPPTSGMLNGSASVTASGGMGNYVYTWSNGAIGATINNLAPGEYCVTVTDAAGCESEPQCVSLITVGIINVNGSNFGYTIQPNPANEIATVSINGIVNNLQLQVLDLNGKVVYATAANSATVSIPTATFPQGFYFCQFMVDGKKVAIEKLAVTR